MAIRVEGYPPDSRDSFVKGDPSPDVREKRYRWTTRSPPPCRHTRRRVVSRQHRTRESESMPGQPSWCSAWCPSCWPKNTGALRSHPRRLVRASQNTRGVRKLSLNCLFAGRNNNNSWPLSSSRELSFELFYGVREMQKYRKSKGITDMRKEAERQGNCMSWGWGGWVSGLLIWGRNLPRLSLFFFKIISNGIDTMWLPCSALHVNVVKNSRQARVNGRRNHDSHVGSHVCSECQKWLRTSARKRRE